VGNTDRKTGGYLYNARLTSGLRKRGYEVEEIVACGASSEEQRGGAQRLGSTFYPYAYDAIVVDALARIAVCPHLDSWRASRPVVALIHELPSVAEGECERDYEEPLLRSDKLVVVSGHGREVLLDRGVEAGRIHVVEPGFDGIPTDDETCVERAGPLRVLCVAQWIPRKEILTLVEAWTLNERPGAVLQLVGETDADHEYQTRVRTAIDAAPSGSIVVSGRVDDAALAWAYASADVFVLASRYEGYGIVYAEALAHGLPVIACSVGPIPELVGREAAILIQPDHKEGLSAALDLLLGDAALRARMSRAAHRRVASLPRWDDTVAAFEAVLDFRTPVA
jgi:glycosyltransferase involved in cell wall biosynthesis